MKAKCIKTFLVEKCDDDGFLIENSDAFIEKDSIWDIEDSNFRVIGADIRLTSNQFGWLEISKEMFEEYFEREE